jgi:hypothetical protein
MGARIGRVTIYGTFPAGFALVGAGPVGIHARRTEAESRGPGLDPSQIPTVG